MRIDSAIITGSFSVNGDTFNDLGVFPSTGSNTFVGNQSIVGAVSASALTGSINYTNLTNVPTLVSGSEQIVSILSPLNSFTASNSTTNTFTSSATARLNSIETITASNISRLTNLESITGSLATTGSNTFIGTQTITGSLYISSDLIVQGTSSLQNITASAVSIGTNIINLNTANPAIRYAGLVIGDSGSVGGSGSFLYDSVQDEMIFVHRGTSTVVTSSVTLMGPETYDNLGNETYPTTNRIQKGNGNEHLVDSCIFDNGTTVCVNATLKASGQVCGIMGTFSCIGIGTASPSTKVHIYEPLTNASAYLTVQNNRARNSAVYTQTTNGGFYAGTSIGTDTFNYQIYDAVAGAARLTIASTGAATFSSSVNVNGILQVKSTSSTPSIWAGAYGGAITILADNATSNRYLDLSIVDSVGALAAQGLRITSGGNLLVGTTTDAGYKLDVNGTGRFSGLLITSGGNVMVSCGFLGVNNTAPRTFVHIVGASCGADVACGFGNADARGILHVQACTGADNSSVTVENVYGIGQFMQWTNQGMRIGHRILKGGSPGDVHMTAGQDGVKLLIYANGNLGAPSGSNIYNASDCRLKKNIRTISYGLCDVMKLQPKIFNWKDNFTPSENGKEMLGFIAQDVQPIVPEVVEQFSDGSDIVFDCETISNPLRVNEKFIIPILTKAIQEQQCMIDTLKSCLGIN